VRSINNIRKWLTKELKECGYEPYLWHRTRHVNGSQYIRFKDARLGSIRIADHPGRKHLGYLFNVRTDIDKGYRELDGKVWRQYYSANELECVVLAVRVRKTVTLYWDKRGYDNSPGKSTKKRRRYKKKKKLYDL